MTTTDNLAAYSGTTGSIVIAADTSTGTMQGCLHSDDGSKSPFGCSAAIMPAHLLLKNKIINH